MKIPRLLPLEVPWQRLKVCSKQPGIAEEDPEEDSEEDPEVHLGQLKRFSLRELEVATDNFSNRKVLGRGGFGKVYKGRLADGSLVAVKRLKEGQIPGGEHLFQAELEVIMAVHRNLLRLRGFCMTRTERLLVYPYMANGSVASCLRERAANKPPLSWSKRRRIALGAARGLSYLHEHCDPKIIHRDVKAANILLDEDFEAVIGDFGLAMLMDCKDTHVTTSVRGTIGHIAPEYLSTGKSSEKTDIFGYGIMLLELITGQPAIVPAGLANGDDVLLLDWVKSLFKERKLDILVDPDLRNFNDIEVEALIQVALLCTQSSPLERPKMSEVVRMLEGDGLAERWEEWQLAERWEEWQKVEVVRIQIEMHASEEDPEVHLGQLKRFSLRELQVATDNFSNRNILGSGGFGKVYKGRLADGSLVAVKRLKEERNAGGELQFQTEVEMISIAVHRNLLIIRGCCMTPTERLLVYPYMVNGSVASCLRERAENVPPLPWSKRGRIALGAAHGLSYLHDHCDPKIIHRDVKVANILLDEDFEAVVGDFGLRKLMDYKDTHVTTAVRGTIGHIAPEYLSTGKTSEKTDVFGYGIMLLELITGQRAFDLARLANDDDVLLLDWVKNLLKGKKLDILVDPDLRNNFNEIEVEALIQVALLCTQASPLERPKMSEVVRMLEGDGLAERWEEWQKVEVVRIQTDMETREAPNMYIDSTYNLAAIELSQPR